MTQQNEAEVRDFIDDDVLCGLESLLEHDRIPTKLELDRFIRSLGYRIIRPDDLKVLTDTEIADAVADYRRILVMNGHKPTPMDGRKAVAQAQLAADKKKLEGM